MADTPSSYQTAYEDAKRELAGLILIEEKIARRKVELRKTIEVLSALCENEGVKIQPSPEAEYLLGNSKMADEVRNILKAKYPAWLRPNDIKTEIAELGYDLTKHDNPQAAIQMVLKRMVESTEAEERVEDGKKEYRSPSQNVSALAYWDSVSGSAAHIAEVMKGQQRAMNEALERIRVYSFTGGLGLSLKGMAGAGKPEKKK